MVAKEIRDIATKCVAAISARGVHVERALLYRSAATGRQTADSDLDIADISRDFGHDRYSEG